MAKLRNVKFRKVPKPDWYWPLGALSYASEIHDYFPEEAQLLGAITILWNRQELALTELYTRLIASRRPDYAKAIWDRQPTHKARRDLIALAMDTAKLTKRQKGVLRWVLDNTKVLADRRNELIHAEYVVHAPTDKLHARVSPPNSSKPPKHQKADVKALQGVVSDLERLVQATEAARFEFYTRAERRRVKQIEQILAAVPKLLGSLQSGFPPQSDHQKPDEVPPPPPE